MVAHTLIAPFGRQRKANLCEFQDSLIYMMYYRLARLCLNNELTDKHILYTGSWVGISLWFGVAMVNTLHLFAGHLNVFIWEVSVQISCLFCAFIFGWCWGLLGIFDHVWDRNRMLFVESLSCSHEFRKWTILYVKRVWKKGVRKIWRVSPPPQTVEWQGDYTGQRKPVGALGFGDGTGERDCLGHFTKWDCRPWRKSKSVGQLGRQGNIFIFVFAFC